MSLTTPTMPERLENLEAELLVYAMAVDRLRHLQRTRSPFETLQKAQEREQAEKEVDELTFRHLLPTPQ